MKSALEELMDRNPILAHAVEDERLAAERNARKERAENDFTFFCDYYLPAYFFCQAAEYQKILYDVIQNRELTEAQAARLREIVPEDFQSTFRAAKNLRGIIDVEPRGHGKSTRMTFAFPLWQLLFKKAKFIIIVGASSDDAQLQMENIRLAIEENDRIIDDFGNLQGTTWNKKLLSLSNGTAVTARGKGGSLRGLRKKQYRPDLVIVDDTFKDNEAESSVIRDKVSRWFNRTIQPLGTEALIIVVNTITNEDDLPSRLLTDIKEGRKGNWVGLRFSAEIPGKDGGQGTPLWPERYSWKDLKTLQSDLGSLAYAQEYLSRPLSDEDRIFKAAWIVRVKASDIPASLAMYEGIDPATGAHDMSAVVDLGRDKLDKKYFVVSSHGKKESTETFTARLIDRFKLFRYRRALMESVAFQAIYKKNVIEKAEEQHIHLPLRGRNPGRGSKAQRLMYISPMVENGVIVFGPGNEDLIDQLVGFPAAGYDDLCDALYYAVLAAEGRGGGGTSALSQKKNSNRNIKKELNL